MDQGNKATHVLVHNINKGRVWFHDCGEVEITDPSYQTNIPIMMMLYSRVVHMVKLVKENGSKLVCHCINCVTIQGWIYWGCAPPPKHWPEGVQGGAKI